MAARSTRRIALLIESSRASGRALLRGIADFAHAQGDWTPYHHERSLAEPLPAWMKRWRGDGILARIESPKLARQIVDLGLPTVDLRGMFDLPGVARVANDQAAIARLAAEHLLERKFRTFGYCGLAGVNYSQQRGAHYGRRLAEADCETSVFEGKQPARPLSSYAIEARGLVDEQPLVRWVKQLPKPAGIFCANDIRGQQVLAACARAGLSVPDEVAVIAAGNDEVVCELCRPALSSVIPDTRRVGYQAAALLERMMAGETPPRVPDIPPLGVATRLSTDVVAIPDVDVAAAARFIRQRACQPIDVEDVLRFVHLSRRTLERRFHHYLGRSPKAEILRAQLARVQQLLRSTDESLEEIAARTGFSHTANMCNLFRRKVGMTPGEYRRQARL